jgi:hypothetical protein
MKIILPLLTIWAVCVLVLIEYKNAEANFVLPRNIEYTGGNGSAKWRTLGQPHKVIPRWVYNDYKSKNNLSPEVELSHEIKASLQPEIDRQIQQSIAEDNLKGIIGTFGLLQYPLAFFLFVSSLIKFKNRIGKFALTSSLLAIGFALYRAYFTSLGW